MANNKRDAKCSIDSLQQQLPKLQKLNTWTGAVLSEHMIGFDQGSDRFHDRSPVCQITKETPGVSYDNVSSIERSQDVNGYGTSLLSNRKECEIDQINATAFTAVEGVGSSTGGEESSLSSLRKEKEIDEKPWINFTDVERSGSIALQENLEEEKSLISDMENFGNSDDDGKENPYLYLDKNEQEECSWGVFTDMENEDLDHAELKVGKMELPYRPYRVESLFKVW